MRDILYNEKPYEEADMKKWIILISVWIFCAPGILSAQAQETELPQLDRLYVRITIYPTVSLSRYDYNNDIDLHEIRAYVELREKSPTGELIEDAQVFVNSNLLEYHADRYEKRIKLQKEEWTQEIEFRIITQDERRVRQKVPVPTWLILSQPMPEIIDRGQDIKIEWRFTKCSCPVDVSVYNFKSGDVIANQRNIEGSELVIPSSEVPSSSIIRIFVMQSWQYKKYLRGSELVQGSEISMIPWSQVFLRTR